MRVCNVYNSIYVHMYTVYIYLYLIYKYIILYPCCYAYFQIYGFHDVPTRSISPGNTMKGLSDLAAGL